jgi:hypothetical protein
LDGISVRLIPGEVSLQYKGILARGGYKQEEGTSKRRIQARGGYKQEEDTSKRMRI